MPTNVRRGQRQYPTARPAVARREIRLNQRAGRSAVFVVCLESQRVAGNTGRLVQNASEVSSEKHGARDVPAVIGEDAAGSATADDPSASSCGLSIRNQAVRANRFGLESPGHAYAATRRCARSARHRAVATMASPRTRRRTGHQGSMRWMRFLLLESLPRRRARNRGGGAEPSTMPGLKRTGCW